MYAYMELVEDSTEYLQDSSLVNIDVRDRDKSEGVEGSVNELIQLRLRRNIRKIFIVAFF